MQACEARAGGVAVRCPVCAGPWFLQREVKIHTTGMTLMGLDWANHSGTGLACIRCGLLMTFTNSSLQVRWGEVSEVSESPTDPEAKPQPHA